ncbi:hypothetical protein XANCAGTX0491_009673 [Xanthoria calcicola]
MHPATKPQKRHQTDEGELPSAPQKVATLESFRPFQGGRMYQDNLGENQHQAQAERPRHMPIADDGA